MSSVIYEKNRYFFNEKILIILLTWYNYITYVNNLTNKNGGTMNTTQIIQDVSAPEIKGSISVKISSHPSLKVTLTLRDFSCESYTSVRFLAMNSRTFDFTELPFSRNNSHSFTLDLTIFRELMEFRSARNFFLILECTDPYGINTLYSLIPDNNFLNNKKYHIFTEHFYFPEDTSPEPTEYIGILTPNNEQKLIIKLCSRRFHMETLLSCNFHSLKMKDGKLTVCFDLDNNRHKYIKTGLFFRSKLEEDAVSYDFVTENIKSHGNFQRVTVSLNLGEIEWKSLYWDIFILIQNADNESVTKLPVSMTALQRMKLKFLYNASYKTAENFYFFPYYTSKRTLAFVNRQREKYDGMDIIFKEFLSVFLYRIAKPYWKHKHICLVCEKFSSMAQDNGYYFFKHCMDQNEEAFLNKKIYYIIDKDSPDRSRIESYSNRILDFMSIRHMIYLLAADLIVSSDSRYHTYAMQSRHSIFNRYIKKIPFVFLQHGVIALKRVDNFYGKGKKGGCNLFVVSTGKEKQTIIDNFGYEPDEVINTGLPRWDVLQDKSQGTREILIMPTWRNWLDSVPDRDFEESDYFQYYMGLLNSERLSQILEKYDLQINFYLHAKFQDYADNFKSISSRIHLISFGEVAVNEMLMRCRMLITDYSSVCWDILYQNKPSLFYQFDIEKYNEAHGSYIDMETELFGDRAETEKQLLDFLEETVQNDFQLKPEYQKMRSEYLQFKDHDHSKHICEEIKKRFF